MFLFFVITLCFFRYMLSFYSSTAQHSTAQHSTAQHGTVQYSTAQHSTAYAARYAYSGRKMV